MLFASQGLALPFDLQDVSDESIADRLAASAIPPTVLLGFSQRCRSEALEPLCEALSAARLREASPPTVSPVESRGSPAQGPRDLEEAFRLVFRLLGEERSGQLDMARAVWRALKDGGVALCEAGTGTGKSLAYLVPLVLHSLETGERAVVSTYTRNLQDQLYRREVPILEQALSVDARAARLFGRENYLCPRNAIVRLSAAAPSDFARALAFALRTALGSDGTIDSLEGIPEGIDGRALAAPPRCGMNACPFAGRCPLVLSRKRAREARILFVNHALLLTDHSQGGTLLGPYSNVVFDEAHHLERCVIENLSVSAGRDECSRIVEALLGAGDDEAWKLLANELECSGAGGNWKHLRREVSRRGKELQRAYESLFRGVELSLNPGRSARRTKTRYTDGGETFAQVSSELVDIYRIINEFSVLLKSIHEASLTQDLGALQQEASNAIEALASLREGLRFLTTGEDEESVFWLDWRQDGALKGLCGSPLGVDRPFADYLEGVLGTAVFTSATLSQGGSFAFFKERLGLNKLRGKPVELIVPPPFPFDENCLVLVATGLGDPNEEAFASPVSELVGALSAEVGRRMLVLFTSYRMCFAVSEALARVEGCGPVFVQGGGESREALSERFRRAPGGVLLGVASFWEGVDFPGEELEVLVIPKIPFPVPTEPIVEARSERLSALGEDPFEKLFLPEAILRMRQGSGRLIRRMNDRGVVIICDPRLGTRPYADAILSSLPSKNISHASIEECVERAARWFGAR